MALVGPKLASSSSRHAILCARCPTGYTRLQRHQFSSCSGPHLKATADEHASRHVRETELERRLNAKAKEKFLDRDFFLSVLNSTSTKREAKSYLQRFRPLLEAPLAQEPATDSSARSGQTDQTCQDPVAGNWYGVNLGSFHVPVKAVKESPVFVQQPLPKVGAHDHVETLHLALVEIRAPQLLDNTTLQGIGQTLAQLGRLGLCSVVILDCESRQPTTGQAETVNGWRKFATEQADRVVEAFESNPGPGARRLDNILGIAPASQEPTSSVSPHSRARVSFKNLLLAPLRRGIIPVIPPIGYTAEQISVPICPDDVMLTLTREFAGLATTTYDEDPTNAAKEIELLQRQISLDRLIILDPLGGIPSPDRPSGAHVYINMEQEFEDVRNELFDGIGGSSFASDAGEKLDSTVSPLKKSKYFSEFAETGIINLPNTHSNQSKDGQKQIPHSNLAHLRNLELLKRTLSLLPPTSSALLTTPLEAANSARPPPEPFRATGVGTRRQRNPLIHNLLTDKPVFSSSLPASRLGPKLPEHSHGASEGITATTLVKRGMPITIIPDPRISPWVPPDLRAKGLTFNDPRVDLPRLVNLIEDSFNRKLDVQHYLSRVNSRLAGLIIAGEYEGGAILTWETPPDCDDDCNEAGRQRLVPYLDKFAVLKRSQGAGGVADIVFKAMVAGCFPAGVCWRSRRGNPVNKWYFERARGTRKIPNSNWTMFWTTENVTANPQTFLDYEGVCRTVVPSWADKKAAAD
ncbi:MAG: Amino-acid acetyltransferase, mitochondrial [Geoglossum simile]|nr:MAG: Amino-acid acetyltransferase, mitochondrial [Geoglossum simile]